MKSDKEKRQCLYFCLRTNDTNLQKQDRNLWLCPVKCLQLFPSVSFHSFTLLSFLLGYLLFILYLASYLWWCEASLSALCNCVFYKSVFVPWSLWRNICPVMLARDKTETVNGEDTEACQSNDFPPPPPPPQLTWGLKSRWTSLNKRWGDQRVDWKLLAVFTWVASGRAVYSGFGMTHKSKCVSEWRD